MQRGGWSGLADRLVSWWTGKPARTIPVDIVASVYAKGADKLQLLIGPSCIESNERNVAKYIHKT